MPGVPRTGSGVQGAWHRWLSNQCAGVAEVIDGLPDARAGPNQIFGRLGLRPTRRVCVEVQVELGAWPAWFPARERRPGVRFPFDEPAEVTLLDAGHIAGDQVVVAIVAARRQGAFECPRKRLEVRAILDVLPVLRFRRRRRLEVQRSHIEVLPVIGRLGVEFARRGQVREQLDSRPVLTRKRGLVHRCGADIRVEAVRFLESARERRPDIHARQVRLRHFLGPGTGRSARTQALHG
ncbi:MAG: hypothetical protein AB1806_17830 [Acidobacteriota bacterium]